MPLPRYFIAAERFIEDKSGLTTLVNLLDELQFARAPSESGIVQNRIGSPIIDMTLLSKWGRLSSDNDSDMFEAKIELRKPFEAAYEMPGQSEFTFGDKQSQQFIIRIVGALAIPDNLPEPPYEYRVKVSIRKKGSSEDWVTDELAIPIKGINALRE